MNKLPVKIDPSLLEIGDTIKVTLPRNQGIVHVMEGTIAERQDSGGIRYYLTKEKATLLAWEIGRKNVRVDLLMRPDKPQTQLTIVSDFLDEVKERIA